MVLLRKYSMLSILLLIFLPCISALGISTLFGTDYIGTSFIFHTRPERGFLNRVWEDTAENSNTLQNNENKPVKSDRSMSEKESFSGLWSSSSSVVKWLKRAYLKLSNMSKS